MRKLIILLLIAGVGYYLYTHQELWRKLVALFQAAQNGAVVSHVATNESMKPFAWKVVYRIGSDALYNVNVELVEGNRWRIEAKTNRTSKILVVVSDGSRAVGQKWVVASDGSMSPSQLREGADSANPINATNQILKLAAQNAEVMQRLSPQVTEQCDGHACWRTTVNYQGMMSASFWIDASSHLPVRIEGTIAGKHLESHWVSLQPDFAGRSSEFFNTNSTKPLFAEYLTPMIPTSTASTPEPRQLPRVGILTTSIQMPVSYNGKSVGTVTLPRGTRVQLISVGKDTVVVSYNDSTATIPATAIERRATSP